MTAKIAKEWPQDTYVLIPSYKSAGPLKLFIDELTSVVPKKFICVVDDASDDGTYEFCQDAGVTCFRHRMNRGKGAALRTGFAYLTGDKYDTRWIVTMDADGQHSVADLPRFLRETGRYPRPGLCIGARDMRLGVMPPARIVSNKLTSGILSILSGKRIKDGQCGFRMYSREFVESIQIEYARFEMESEVILKAAAKKFPIRFVPVRTLYLKGGSSHISHAVDTARWTAAVAGVWLGARAMNKKNKKN